MTKQELAKKIQNQILANEANEAEAIRLYNVIAGAIGDSQPINKRLATKIQKELAADKYCVVYRNQYGMFHIDIYRSKQSLKHIGEYYPDYQGDKWSFLLGYESSPERIVTRDLFARYSICYGQAAIGRNEARINQVSDEKTEALADAILKYQEAKRIYSELIDQFEDKYAIEKLIGE